MVWVLMLMTLEKLEDALSGSFHLLSGSQHSKGMMHVWMRCPAIEAQSALQGTCGWQSRTIWQIRVSSSLCPEMRAHV